MNCKKSKHILSIYFVIFKAPVQLKVQWHHSSAQQILALSPIHFSWIGQIQASISCFHVNSMSSPLFNFDLTDVHGWPLGRHMNCIHTVTILTLPCGTNLFCAMSHYQTKNCCISLVDSLQLVIALISIYLWLRLELWHHVLFLRLRAGQFC